MHKYLVVLGAAVIAVEPVSAVKLTFDTLRTTNASQGYNEVREAGFVLTGDTTLGSPFVVWGDGPFVDGTIRNADQGGAALSTNYSGITVTLRRVDGGLFDFGSIALGDIFNQGTAEAIALTFTDQMGSITESITTDTFAGLQTFTFNRAGLSQVTMRATAMSDAWFQFDDIVLDELPVAGAVPEPGVWLMMAIGFGAVGLAVRRRSSPAVAK